MRITKLPLEPEETIEIEALTDEITAKNKDITLAYDFAKDAYSIFKEKVDRRRNLKSYWNIFTDIRTDYAKYKMMDLMKNVDFYNRVRNFFRYFMTSHLFYELDKLDAIEALKIFLNMFPTPEQEKQQQKQQQQQSQQKNQSQPKSRKKKQPDQKGRSADEGNLPIDMSKFKQQLPQIEKALDSGILDKEDLQSYLQKNAGIGHNEFKIGNIVNLVNKISNNLHKRDLEIFYVARKKEATELYRRDEILESVPFPEDEMTIKTLDNPVDILKLVPTQYAYDDDIFMQKLVKHELLIKDYQTRRLKRQALYLLIDISGSMQGGKNIYASGVALAFVRQAISEGSTYYLRFFNDSPHQLYTVTTKEEAEKMSETLIRQPFSGGGTSIQRAISTAVSDIIDAPDKFEKAEIMLISDGEDGVSLTKNDLKKVKLHSTIIDGHNRGLEELSETYVELDSSNLD